VQPATGLSSKVSNRNRKMDWTVCRFGLVFGLFPVLWTRPSNTSHRHSFISQLVQPSQHGIPWCCVKNSALRSGLLDCKKTGNWTGLDRKKTRPSVRSFEILNKKTPKKLVLTSLYMNQLQPVFCSFLQFFVVMVRLFDYFLLW
jgi:hypothetical protein